jgi:hypothetical protein
VEKLLDFAAPTAVAFGPDGNLYVGSTSGQLGRFTLNDNYDKVVSSVVSTIDPTRGIHSIAFDPLETAELGNNINVYISTSRIFHLEPRNSFGNGINGKIQTVKGANLDIVTDIVTGLPVSELDHAVRESRLHSTYKMLFHFSITRLFSHVFVGQRHLLWRQWGTVHCRR